jgi:hypothetical protein
VRIPQSPRLLLKPWQDRSILSIEKIATPGEQATHLDRILRHRCLRIWDDSVLLSTSQWPVHWHCWCHQAFLPWVLSALLAKYVRERGSWEGLHRYLALMMLAYTFLMLQSLSREVQTNPLPGVAFPPMRQLSLPACHRQMLILLFQDVVLWLIETEQIKSFRPRRN